MNAILEPRKGKYYGTIVKITDGPYKGHEIKLWISIGDGVIEPSIRELEYYGVTQEQWDKNSQIGNYPMDTPWYCNGKPGEPILARDALNICDSHFEGRVALEAAMGLIKVLENIN